MSDEKNDLPRMSFEDAIRKAATKKVDKAIMIEGKDIRHEIPDASGKYILFKQITLADKKIDNFLFWVSLIQKKDGYEYLSFSYDLLINPYQIRTDTAMFNPHLVGNSTTNRLEEPYQKNPLFIDKDKTLMVSVKPLEIFQDQDFEVGILNYDFLEDY